MGNIRFKGDVSGNECDILETADGEISIIDGDVTVIKADTTTVTDASGIELAGHGSRHVRGGPDPTNDENVTNFGDSGNKSCAIGVNSTASRTTLYTLPTNWYNMIPQAVTLTFGGTFASGESVDANVKVIFDNGSQFSIGSVSVTATGTEVLDTATIMKNLLTNVAAANSNIDQHRVTEVVVDAYSSAASTSVTLTARVLTVLS